jgi:hypothetical protein
MSALADYRVTEGAPFPENWTEIWSDGEHQIFKRGYSVRTDASISAAVGQYYFEIEVISDGGTGYVRHH